MVRIWVTRCHLSLKNVVFHQKKKKNFSQNGPRENKSCIDPWRGTIGDKIFQVKSSHWSSNKESSCDIHESESGSEIGKMMSPTYITYENRWTQMQASRDSNS